MKVKSFGARGRGGKSSWASSVLIIAVLVLVMTGIITAFNMKPKVPSNRVEHFCDSGMCAVV